MKLLIKNTEYYEWKIPGELLAGKDPKEIDYQDLIDRYFDIDNLATAKESDDYYELVELRH